MTREELALERLADVVIAKLRLPPGVAEECVKTVRAGLQRAEEAGVLPSVQMPR